MPKPRNIFSHLSIEMAARASKCDRKRAHHVDAGEYYLAVKARNSTKTYCQHCAREILSSAGNQLSELRTLLERGPNLLFAGLYRDGVPAPLSKKEPPQAAARRVGRLLD